MNPRMMIRNPRPTYAAETDAGAAPVAAPAADPAVASETAAEGAAPAADQPTLLGGAAPSPGDDPSPATGEGEQAEAAGEKTGDGDAAEVAPVDKSGDTLDIAALKAPEGFETLDAEALAAAEPALRELGLDTAQAQQVVDLAAKVLPSLIEKALASAEADFGKRMAADHAAWVKGCETDKEIGGNVENLNENVAHARRFRDRFATPALVELLEASKLGDNPEMVRLFARAGKALSEDSFHVQDTAAQEAPKPPEALLYGAEFQPKAKAG